jgi:hypothetical protein
MPVGLRGKKMKNRQTICSHYVFDGVNHHRDTFTIKLRNHFPLIIYHDLRAIAYFEYDLDFF